MLFIFADRHAYLRYAQSIGVSADAGGHYESAGMKRLMTFQDTPDPFAILEHQGMEQLVDCVRMLKWNRGTSLFWRLQTRAR
ncbi:MAG: hypothetical protein HZA54_09280 [Planctomycetes bacterium]|nr:hypothetical protein [Planctomycetota bacterium]